MKTRIFFLSTFFILVLASQTYSQFITGLGIKAGATFSDDNIEYLNSMNWLTRYHIGYNASIYADLLSSKGFSIQTEAGYDQRGYKILIIRTNEFGEEIGEYNVGYDTHYFTAAIMGKLKFPGECMSSYFLAGPRLDVYLGYSTHQPSDVAGYEKNYFLDDFKKVNYSVNLGAGIEFNKLLPFKTFIEFNYLPSISTSLETQNIEIKEHSYNIKLGINFIKDKIKKTKK